MTMCKLEYPADGPRPRTCPVHGLQPCPVPVTVHKTNTVYLPRADVYPSLGAAFEAVAESIADVILDVDIGDMA